MRSCDNDADGSIPTSSNAMRGGDTLFANMYTAS